MSRTYEGHAVVGERTVGAVQRTLQRHNRPMTVSELSRILGKSDPTVRKALEKAGAAEDRTVWPRVWSLPDSYAPPAQLGASTDNVLVPVILGEPAWAPRWNEAAQRVGEGIAKLQITPESDPVALMHQFIIAAQSLASVALAIQQAKDRPDWYAKLGGALDE